MNATSQGVWRRVPGWRDGDLGGDVILIERTAKRWKALMLIAAAIAAFGFMLVAWQVWSGLYAPLLGGTATAWPRDAEAALVDGLSGPSSLVGACLLVAALGLGIYARFMAWWRHG